MYQKNLSTLFDTVSLEDLQEELMEFDGLANKVAKIMKPQKLSKKFKNKLAYE